MLRELLFNHHKISYQYYDSITNLQNKQKIMQFQHRKRK
jgi:hypothetical protein